MKKSIVGVLCGGFSSEKEISFKSGINVMKNLSEKLWNSYLIKFNNNEWYVEDKEENKYSFFINDFSLISVYVLQYCPSVTNYGSGG